MLLSLKWLKNYVDISDISPEELAEKITLSGIEVEKVYTLSSATNCVVGEVLEKIKHPQADKLSVCSVNLGDQVTQIVCGAPNVDKGQKVIVSKVGATLPNGMKIKKAKLRGVESNGMICSLKELGIENKLVPQEYQNGIMVLDDAAVVGIDAINYLGFDDTILELGLTPNRSDCLSMLGIAYEVAAILDKEIKKPVGEKVPFSKDPHFKVKIDSQDCSLYYAKKIKNIQIKKSPKWLQSSLIACGVRPINNVVDVTNYVMLELGQPLHAFDFKKLNSNEILVRNAKNNESITTLDDIKRELMTSDLVITDGKRPIALGGVMGGQNTEIDNDTTDILLESAVFKPLTIRKTYTRLGLRSEASIRYEKQVDPNRTLYALNRACQLIVEIANGKIDDKLSVASNLVENERLIKITLDKINRVLGIDLSKNDVVDVLRRVKFDFVVLDGSFVVTVPTRRPDISIREDLIEEIIRIHGYHHLNKTLPKTDTFGALTDNQTMKRMIKHTLLASGLNEVMTYSLTNEKYISCFNYLSKNIQPIKLAMPMSEERSMMRTGLIHSLVEVISYNHARNIDDMLIFELGKKYDYNQEKPQETYLLSGACTGVVSETKWQKQKEIVDFFYVKGILEKVFDKLNILNNISFIQETNPGKEFHPMRSASILLKNDVIGIIGQIHPNTQKDYDINETYVFEINLEPIFETKTEEVKFSSISKYPTVTRDIAIVVNEEINVQVLLDAIRSKGKSILKSVEVFDVYQGEHVEEDKKSVAFSLLFENVEKTLTDEEVNAAYNRIVKHLEGSFEAILRK
ncbi:phenylalanine--tRNA ligase subunit beta [Mycoplasmatota bacterium]|nr:phenylalanine--tRNA ligase subunit beta [Mycoplasmatota bacterium]